MASASTRSQLVTRALTMAGRGVELTSLANELLNDMLRSWALDFRYPSLRKIGSPLTLALGQSTVALPSDFGAGMEKQGMIIGQSNQPIDEKTYEEFAALRGLQNGTITTGRPSMYMVDKVGENFLFNSTADQAYALTPTYFYVPANLPTDASGDNQKVWVDNDEIVVEGLIHKIFQFKEDVREEVQFNKLYHPVQGLLMKWQKQVGVIGGTGRIMPSPSKFKTIRFGF